MRIQDNAKNADNSVEADFPSGGSDLPGNFGPL